MVEIKVNKNTTAIKAKGERDEVFLEMGFAFLHWYKYFRDNLGFSAAMVRAIIDVSIEDYDEGINT